MTRIDLGLQRSFRQAVIIRCRVYLQLAKHVCENSKILDDGKRKVTQYVDLNKCRLEVAYKHFEFNFVYIKLPCFKELPTV